ncbi:hypothetical protein J2X06_001686 [Lysobacter niastensis]|uniref:Uncharacterized protein n=1 Tax=Lysobacter niastensis TaxID=380629 RepID=A0ABU1WA51_9GAMM|nr:hypothetical protein [Lysobacter niastensis]MDR7134502.1 hypothetical protein [Lysobacter niastensis]
MAPATMVFAEFYRTNRAGALASVGGRFIVILDGRNDKAAWHVIAARECARRDFEAYQLRQGRGFTDSKAVSGLVVPSVCGGREHDTQGLRFASRCF